MQRPPSPVRRSGDSVAVRVVLEAPHAGWSTWTISVAGREWSIVASYLGDVGGYALYPLDSFAALARAAKAMLAGEPSAEVRVTEEILEHRIVLRRVDGGVVLSVETWDETIDTEPLPTSSTDLGVVDPVQFAQAVLEAMDRACLTDPKAFKREWGQKDPRRDIEKLRRRLRATR